MHRNIKVSVVIPCYNEEQGIGLILEKIPKFIDEVIIVDNGSSDKTMEVARRFRVKVLHEKQKGYGAALKTGIRHATGTLIITLDGDASYPIEESKKMIDYLLNNNLDFVSGCRLPLTDRNSMNYTNVIGTKILNAFAFMLFWKLFRDILSGMWVFKKDAYTQLISTSNDWNFSEEIKIEAARKLRFGECHINHFTRIGNTKLLKWRVGFENLIFLFWKRMFPKSPLPYYLKIT